MPELIITILAVLAFFTYGIFLYTSEDRSNPQNDIIESMEDMTILSSAFTPNTSIPEVYSCDGENVNPPLSFGNIPTEAKSLALIVDDPDIPEWHSHRFH